MPTHCPECGTPLAPAKGATSIPLPQRPVLSGSCGRGISPRRRRTGHRGPRLHEAATALLAANVITDEGDLFALTADDLIRAKFFRTPRTARSRPTPTRLLKNLQDAKDRPLWRILVALSIPPCRPHRRPRSWRPAFGDLERSWRDRAAAGRRRGRPDHRRGLARWFDVDWHRAIVQKWQAAGTGWPTNATPTSSRRWPG